MLYIAGMHGLGDNLHQRGILRQLPGDIWLETSWPAVYHDMPQIHCVAKGTSLRTQLKNAARQPERFERAPAGLAPRRILYTPAEVKATGSVLAAMCRSVGVDHDRADFRLPVKPEWVDQAREFVRTDRPILVYRPLVERREWGGCATRNPDHGAYARLLAGIRDRYHLVSIADLEPGQEWMVGEPVEADQTFHAGELPFEAIAGLFSLASLVWTAPGFAVVLAQAIGTPVIAVFGGYESSRSFSSGARYSPYLGIDPIRPCECWSHRHRCNKRIDEGMAGNRIEEFIRVAD